MAVRRIDVDGRRGLALRLIMRGEDVGEKMSSY
jgi:hypothetical protein